LEVRRDRDFVISNRQHFRNHSVHFFAQHQLTVLAACAENYPVFAAVVSFLSLGRFYSFVRHRLNQSNRAACAGLGSTPWGSFVKFHVVGVGGL